MYVFRSPMRRRSLPLERRRREWNGLPYLAALADPYAMNRAN
jgi:hypothetical protein